MRVEKSAYERKIECDCGCVFYVDGSDYRSDGVLFWVCCPQCRAMHVLGIDEYVRNFDKRRRNYEEVEIGEVRKTATDGKRVGAVQKA